MFLRFAFNDDAWIGQPCNMTSHCDRDLQVKPPTKTAFGTKTYSSFFSCCFDFANLYKQEVCRMGPYSGRCMMRPGDKECRKENDGYIGKYILLYQTNAISTFCYYSEYFYCCFPMQLANVFFL